MKNKTFITLITFITVTLAANAEFGAGLSSVSDYTGEAFFRTPSSNKETAVTTNSSAKEEKSRGTTPPIKQLRLKLQEYSYNRQMKNAEFAPTIQEEPYQGEVGTSEFASKEIEEDFEEMSAEGFQENSDETNVTKKRGLFGKKNKVAEPEDEEGMILDCEVVDYDTENHLVYATGNVNVTFVKQDVVVKSDNITYDRLNNTIKAEGNVRIIKSGYVTKGDYIFVDLNEENAVLENPITESPSLKIISDKGMVCGDKLVLEKGKITVQGNHEIDFRSGKRGPNLSQMLLPPGQEDVEDSEKGIYKLKARDIIYTEKGDLEKLAIKRGVISSKGKTIFKFPAVKLYTNKNHDYGETNFWEIGSYRGLGLFTGPGWVFELPKGSVLKAIPFFNYKSGAGIGGMLRFNSGTNQTTAAYGTAASKFFVYGLQRLDDNLYMQYSVNSFMDEWFMGRRRPKYGVSLIYDKGYSSDNFLIKDHTSTIQHRLEAGYFQDLDFDGHFERIQGHNTGTTRFKYMVQGTQNFLKYKDEDKQKAFSLDAVAQLAAGLYGTGDTQIVGRVGPRMHTQYKRWMQDIGYFFSTIDDNTPMRAFDAYRYGSQNVYLRESLRICRWFTLSWFGSINVSNDAANGRKYQENSVYCSFGPDEYKLHLGYDFERETFYCNFEIMMDAKGTEIEYDKLEIKQEKKQPKKENKIVQTRQNEQFAPTQPRVLQRAVVEDIKVNDNVL